MGLYLIFHNPLEKIRFRLVKAHHDATPLGGFFRGDLIGKDEKTDGFARAVENGEALRGALWGVGDTRTGHQRNNPCWLAGFIAFLSPSKLSPH